MEEKISKSIINRMLTGRLQAVNMLAGRLQAVKLLAALLMLTPWLALPQQADAQTTYGQTPRGNREQTKKQKKKEKKPTEVDYPLYNGFSVGMDLWGLGGKVFGSDFVSTEVAVDVDLKHRYFPVAEIGYGSTDTWSDKGIHYKSSAPYLRLGMDYNMLFRKAHGHQLRLGLRYATSSFDYDVQSLGVSDPIYGGMPGNPNISDDVWGSTVPFDHRGMKGSMQWMELCVGIRANVWGNLAMGWAMRFKFKLSGSSDTYGDPWYVPGFGQYASNTLGITYTLVYQFGGKTKPQIKSKKK